MATEPAGGVAKTVQRNLTPGQVPYGASPASAVATAYAAVLGDSARGGRPASGLSSPTAERRSGAAESAPPLSARALEPAAASEPKQSGGHARSGPASSARLLAAAGVTIGEQEALLDHAQIEHIPVPKFSGSERRRYAPRPDLVLDVVIAKTPGTVNALRLLRARAPIDPPPAEASQNRSEPIKPRRRRGAASGS